jgi:hypothetical protein
MQVWQNLHFADLRLPCRCTSTVPSIAVQVITTTPVRGANRSDPAVGRSVRVGR